MLPPLKLVAWSQPKRHPLEAVTLAGSEEQLPLGSGWRVRDLGSCPCLVPNGYVAGVSHNMVPSPTTPFSHEEGAQRVTED